MWSACECVKMHRVQVIDPRAQRLGAEIGRGVDQDVAAVVAHQHRRAQPIVARIGEVQTSQWQPMVGTPTLVPEPSTVIFTGGAGIQAFCAAARLVGDLHETEAQFRQ